MNFEPIPTKESVITRTGQKYTPVASYVNEDGDVAHLCIEGGNYFIAIQFYDHLFSKLDHTAKIQPYIFPAAVRTIKSRPELVEREDRSRINPSVG